jgi:hypothetical protein
MTQLIFNSNTYVVAIVVLAVILLAVELPYRYGRDNDKLAAINERSWSTIQAGLLTLVSFMLGLSYAQAQGRFDSRRELVVKEANSIGTTWLRADQLSAADAVTFRRILKAYTAERLQAYSTPNAPSLYARVLRDSAQQQDEMWRIASTALREQPTMLGRSLLMETLNDTIDVSSEQLTALTQHVPTPVILLTFLLVILGSICIGLQLGREKSRPAMLIVLYAFALTIVLNLVIDYDRPATGLIRVSIDPIRTQLKSMK